MTERLSTREQWELLIPHMGYMAVIRNLRNFDQAEIGDSLANKICQRIADPEEVRNSRQLPFRFLSAYLNAPSLRWGYPLEQALSLCVPNVPVLSRPTLILTDVSGSMRSLMGTDQRRDEQARSRARQAKRPYVSPAYPDRMTAAAIFAVALALKNPGKVDLFAFATTNFRVDNIGPGTSLLKTVQTIIQHAHAAGGGTQIARNLAQVFDRDRHRQVALFTDEQTAPGAPGWDQWRGQYLGDVNAAIPADVPLFSWNLAGYEFGCLPTGNSRFSLAGLSDASFAIMDLLLAGRSGKWPWELGYTLTGGEED